MQSKEFLINSIERVKRFVNVTVKFEEDIDLVAGKYIVNGKSILAIFSLDLFRPITVRINTDDLEQADRFFKEVEKALKG